MEIPGQSGNGLGAVDASTESTLRRLTHGYRRWNVLASPFLRLPTELILKIFVHVIELDDNDYGHGHNHYLHGTSILVLTAICHQLREAGTAYPQLWGVVDLTIPPIAELFLERCKYDPHILKRTPSTSERLSMYPVENPRRDAAWEKLEGCTFNRLRSVVFKGTQREFVVRVVGILRRAPNVSNLEIDNTRFHPRPPWSIDDPLPNLSTLRVCKLWISWTSPLLRNLTKLVLDFSPPDLPPEDISIKMFLTALANCPGLEVLDLAHTGPDPLDGLHDNCDTVVQLHRLRSLSLQFSDPSTVGYILSHIVYPESTRLTVYVSASANPDPAEIISQALPQRNVRTVQHCRKSTELDLYLHNEPLFSTDKLSFGFRGTEVYRAEPLVSGPKLWKWLEGTRLSPWE